MNPNIDDIHSKDHNERRCIQELYISVVKTEHELETVLLGIRIPMRPVPVTGIISLVLYLSGRYPESNCFVRLCGNLQKMLC